MIQIFGYIKPYKMELKLKDIKRYQSLYCSLCEKLKIDYGFFSRFFVNYDVTFLLVYLESLSDDEKTSMRFRCPYNPLRLIKSKVSDDVLKYCAFINYWLVVEKLQDDIQDNKNLFRKIVFNLLRHNKKYVENLKEYKDSIALGKILLGDIYKLEENADSIDDFDMLSNKFGSFFISLFDNNSEHIPSSSQTKSMSKIFFQIGKWIYIMDAFDDYADDQKKHSFNLLNLLFDDYREKAPTQQQIFDSTYGIHLQILSKIKKSLNDEDLKIEPCISNVLEYGMHYVFSSIKNKKYKNCGGIDNGKYNFLEFVD